MTTEQAGLMGMSRGSASQRWKVSGSGSAKSGRHLPSDPSSSRLYFDVQTVSTLRQCALTRFRPPGAGSVCNSVCMLTHTRRWHAVLQSAWVDYPTHCVRCVGSSRRTTPLCALLHIDMAHTSRQLPHLRTISHCPPFSQAT